MSTAAPTQVTSADSTARRSFGGWFARFGWRHLVAWLAIIYAAFPLVYVLSASFNPEGTLTGSNKLFQAFSLQNYEALLNNPIRPYLRWYANTLIISGSTAILTVLLGAMAAYAFSRMRFAGRRTGLMSLLLIQMFPQLLMVVAIFLLLSQLGDVIPQLGIGSALALILVYLGGALGTNTYLMYGFFNTVPMALDEAAKVDGASHARIFFTIILRLVAPILAVVGLLSFVATFNEYVVASVVLGNDPAQNTLAIGLFSYVSEQFNSNWQVFAAGAVLASLPVLVLFLWLQKYIVGGLTVGAVK